MKVGVYYTAWSGHQGGDVNVYIEGLTQPQRRTFHAKQATQLKSDREGDDGLVFMILATVNVTKVTFYIHIARQLSSSQIVRGMMGLSL